MRYLRGLNILKDTISDDFYAIHPITVTTQVCVTASLIALALTFQAIQADEIKISGTVEVIDRSFRNAGHDAFTIAVKRTEWEKTLRDNSSIGLMDLQHSLKGLVYSDWYRKALAEEEEDPTAEVGKSDL
jgi:hypothetical protein